MIVCIDNAPLEAESDLEPPFINEQNMEGGEQEQEQEQSMYGQNLFAPSSLLPSFNGGGNGDGIGSGGNDDGSRDDNNTNNNNSGHERGGGLGNTRRMGTAVTSASSARGVATATSVNTSDFGGQRRSETASDGAFQNQVMLHRSARTAKQLMLGRKSRAKVKQKPPYFGFFFLT